MILLIYIFCHSIILAILFAILKDGLTLYEKSAKFFAALQTQVEGLMDCVVVF